MQRPFWMCRVCRSARRPAATPTSSTRSAAPRRRDRHPVVTRTRVVAGDRMRDGGRRGERALAARSADRRPVDRVGAHRALPGGNDPARGDRAAGTGRRRCSGRGLRWRSSPAGCWPWPDRPRQVAARSARDVARACQPRENSRTHEMISATTPSPMRPAARSATARTNGECCVKRIRLLQPRRAKMSYIPAPPMT